MAHRPAKRQERRPSIGGAIAKIAIGVMFIGVGFGDPGEADRVSFLVVSLTLGLALIAWGLIPWLRTLREEKRLRLEEERLRQEAERLRAERKAAQENEARVCPNCGATGRGRICEYCGSPLL